MAKAFDRVNHSILLKKQQNTVLEEMHINFLNPISQIDHKLCLYEQINGNF